MIDSAKLLQKKVVNASEMARIEKLSFAEGYSDALFMDLAGDSIVHWIENFLSTHHLPKIVILLVGKGNNGGDALNAGTKLLKKGYQVSAWCCDLDQDCSPLNQKERAQYRLRGGILTPFKEGEHSLSVEGIIVDGLLGTGFKGTIENKNLKTLIRFANQTSLPILAIDIPSGLSGDTGCTDETTINATETLFLGLAKKGFFTEEGWKKVGTLVRGDFGLPEKYYVEANENAYLIDHALCFSLLPKVPRTRHKYQAGYVLGVAGSKGMAGAAMLSSFAVLRSGAGIVRLFHDQEISAELISCHPEVIKEPFSYTNIDRIIEEAKRAKSLYIGPGIGRFDSSKDLVKRVLESINLPLVIDGDALSFFDELKIHAISKSIILTPHHQEMLYLLRKRKGDLSFEELKSCAQQYVDENNVTIILKGAPTWIFSKETKPFIMPRGTPAMAKAGSGDVLTGIIAALLAQSLDCVEAAILGSYLHALAGEAASSKSGVYSVVASDIIENLPEAFTSLC